MGVVVVPLVITTDANGAGTAASRVIRGEVLQVVLPATLLVGGSADWTITHQPSGGSIVAMTNVPAGATHLNPRQPYHTTAGVIAGTADGAGIPVSGTITAVVAQGARPSVAGTVHIYYRT